METKNFSITEWVTVLGKGKAKLKGLWW